MNLKQVEGLLSSLNSTIVTCPNCAQEDDLSDCDLAAIYVTYWGDSEPKDWECPSCGFVAQVEERVLRSFTFVEEG